MSNYCNIYFFDISMDDYYVTLNDSNVGYLTINDRLKYHRINSLRILTINDNFLKLQILHEIILNRQTCGFDAITFDGSMNSLEVTLTVSHNGFLKF